MNVFSLRTLTGFMAVPLLVLTGPAVNSASAATMPAWVSIFDGDSSTGEAYTLGSSLNDAGYIAAGDVGGNGILGGAYATQAGAAAFDVQESPTALGQASLNFEYADATPLAAGVAQIVNFNISGADDPGGLSDTLSVTLTGHLDGTNNMSVDMHFLSNNDMGMFPAALANGIAIDETGQYQDVSAAIQAATGLSDINVRFTSTVPEPGTFVLLGAGLIGLGGWRKSRAAGNQ